MTQTTKTKRLNPADKNLSDYAPVTINDIKRIKTNLRRRRGSGKRVKSWGEIAKDFPRVARGTLQRFTASDYVPRDRTILARLGVRVVSRIAFDLLTIIHGENVKRGKR